MSEVLLAAEGLRRDYRMGPSVLTVLADASMSLAEGEVLGVLGHSGAGKSTLVHILGLLDRPTAGRVIYRGRDMSGLSAANRSAIRNEAFGFVFQFYHLLAELTAVENVFLPAMIGVGFWRWPGRRREARRRAEELLERVGLSERLRHRPGQLSGGERQRVAIARALMNHPRILFCDEPTGNLDSKSAASVESLLWDLRAATGMSMIVVTHDEDLARRADRVLRLADGRIVDPAGPPVQTVDTLSPGGV